MMQIRKLSLAILTAFAAVIPAADADVEFFQSGDLITFGFQNEAYTLTGAQDASDIYVALIDVFSSGGDAVFFSSLTGGSVTYSINGGTAVSATLWTGWNYRPGSQAVWTPEDAAILLDVSPGTWTIGDQITIDGSITVDSTTDVDAIFPDLLGATASTVLGTGAAYITTPQSTNVVPEPGEYPIALGLISLGMLLFRRRTAGGK